MNVGQSGRRQVNTPNQPRRLRVLLVPSATQWIQGTKARAIADANPWIDATIISGGVLHGGFPSFADLTERIDLVHFLSLTSFQRIGQRLLHRVPCVATVAHIDDWNWSLSVSSADAIMYVSSQWRDEMIRRGVAPARLHGLSNGVDADVFRPVSATRREALRRTFGLPKEAFVVGFAAKRSSDTMGRKGPDMFTEGIRRLRAHVPAVVPFIIGPGWRDWVRDLAREGVRTVWQRFIPDYRRFADVYRCMDLFWITARREGGPLTLLEAMASGVCCISTPVGMVREVVRDGENAALVPLGDVDHLVRVSTELAGDPRRRSHIGREGRRTMIAGYQWKQTAQAAAGLYAAAIRRFAERAGRPVREDLLAAINTPTAPASLDDGRADYLSAIPSRMRSRVQAAEAGQWARRLALMGDTKAAIRYGLAVCARRPFDAHQWRHIVTGIAISAVRRRRRF